MPFYPNVVPAPVFQRRFLARFLFEKSWRSIPFGRSFSFQGTIGKTKSQYIDIKNQREFFSRFKMMKLCIGSANSETTCLFLTNHANRQCVNGWCGYDRLPLALPKKSFILFNCCDIQTVILYHIEQMFVCQDFTHRLYTKRYPVR